MIRGATAADFSVVDYDENSKEKPIEELISDIMIRMEKIVEKVDAKENWKYIIAFYSGICCVPHISFFNRFIQILLL